MRGELKRRSSRRRKPSDDAREVRASMTWVGAVAGGRVVPLGYTVRHEPTAFVVRRIVRRLLDVVARACGLGYGHRGRVHGADRRCAGASPADRCAYTSGVWGMTSAGAAERGRISPLAGWGIVALAAAGIVYVAATLTGQGLWFDDLFTVVASDPRQPFLETLQRYLVPDPSPPLHYILMRAWRMVAPDDEVFLRIPGFAAYVLAIAAAAFYPCRAVRPEERIVLGGLMATSFGAIYYASELRAYALLPLLSLILLLDALAVADALAVRERPAPARLATMVAVGSMLSYEHYFGFLYAGSLVGALLALGLWQRRWSWHVLAVGVAIAAGIAPWLALQLPALAGISGGGFWIELSPLGALRGFLRHTFTAAIPAGLLAAAVGWSLWTTRGAIVRDRRLALAGTAAAINVVVPLAMSLHTPVLVARYFTCLRTLVYFGLAVLLAPLLRAWRGASLVLAALVALLVSYPFVTTPRASWREPSTFVREATECVERDIVAISDWGRSDVRLLEPMFRYYLPDQRFHLTVVRRGEPIEAVLGALNPTAPGCDVVAIATNNDPTQPDLATRQIAATPFAGVGYAVERWPSAFVVRRLAR
jgi:hypothetical protein